MVNKQAHLCFILYLLLFTKNSVNFSGWILLTWLVKWSDLLNLITQNGHMYFVSFKCTQSMCLLICDLCLKTFLQRGHSWLPLSRLLLSIFMILLIFLKLLASSLNFNCFCFFLFLEVSDSGIELFTSSGYSSPRSEMVLPVLSLGAGFNFTLSTLTSICLKFVLSISSVFDVAKASESPCKPDGSIPRTFSTPFILSGESMSKYLSASLKSLTSSWDVENMLPNAEDWGLSRLVDSASELSVSV